jgi:hypothetical protein
MARISKMSRHGKYRVSIRGALSVRDLGRLERACGPALEYERPPLEIHVSPTTTLDDASRVFLKRLATRGAIVLGVEPAAAH